MKKITLAILALLFSGTLAAAQLYRWVDDKGNVEWRDTPPPSGAKQVEQRSIRPNKIDTGAMPYEVKRAAREFPVTLWATKCGDPCDKARAHLTRRGVPYTEKNPESDIESYKKLMGGLEIPVLVVGREQRKGYLESEWDDALDFAGYPRHAGSSVAVPAAAAPESR
jgi:hypothetical protein